VHFAPRHNYLAPGLRKSGPICPDSSTTSLVFLRSKVASVSVLVGAIALTSTHLKFPRSRPATRDGSYGGTEDIRGFLLFEASSYFQVHNLALEVKQ
jgi:hypothetical protein